MRTILFSTMIIVVVATVITIILGTSTFEGTVVQDPYETGLRWDTIQHQRRDSGWSAALLTRRAIRGRNDVSVAVHDRAGQPLRGAVIQLMLDRPATSSRGISARAQERRDGTFHATMDIPLRGSWSATIGVTLNGNTITFDDALFVE